MEDPLVVIVIEGGTVSRLYTDLCRVVVIDRDNGDGAAVWHAEPLADMDLDMTNDVDAEVEREEAREFWAPNEDEDDED